MAYISIPHLAQDLADKIFDNIDEYGVEEVRALVDLFSGHTSVENYIAGTSEDEEDEE